MSSESWDGRYMAAFYSRERILTLSRDERIAHMEAKLADLEAADKEELERHKRDCPACQAGELCLWGCFVRPEQVERRELQSHLRRYIHSERRDAEYAAEARAHGVDYKDHIDGFCSYWQNLRHRLFVAVGWKCERCGTETGALEAHHVHYDTVGFEELADLRALCPSCHKALHRGSGRASAV